MNLNTNEKWLMENIRDIIRDTRFGKVRFTLTVNNYNVSTIKQEQEKSLNFNNKN